MPTVWFAHGSGRAGSTRERQAPPERGTCPQRAATPHQAPTAGSSHAPGGSIDIHVPIAAGPSLLARLGL